MNPSRKGKIARLPLEIREELNQRLLNGESGRKLIAWLNALPAVQAVLASEFRGQPINEPNFTAWRQGGYRQWLQEQEARRLARELGLEALAGDPTGGPPPTEALAWWVAANYAGFRGDVDTAENRAEEWRLLREMTTDVVALRRSDHNQLRLDIERQWQALAWVKAEEKTPRMSRRPSMRLRIRPPVL